MLLAPVFGQFAFNSGFEDGGSVAFEVGLDALEIGNGFVEAGELLFDLCDDELLLMCRSNRNFYLRKLCSIDIRLTNTRLSFCNLTPIVNGFEEIGNLFWDNFSCETNTN